MGHNLDRVETLCAIGAIAEKSAKDYGYDLWDVSDMLLLTHNVQLSDPGLLEESWYKNWLVKMFETHSAIDFDTVFP